MKYEYWFANLKGISNERKRQIRRNFKTAEELYYIEETALKMYDIQEKERKIILDSFASWEMEREYEKLLQRQVRFVISTDEVYPKRLRNIVSAPYALYVKGRLPEEDALSVAVVGARECSPYGESMAREFSKALATEGVQIISGMARGVDGAAQRGALEVGGTSYGVLGCGVDICYPREQIGLYMELQEKGGVLSEFPVGSSPLPQHFPARNRIISGLADVVLVLEAKEKSGSLITADMALEQGKDVYALPGPINSRLSKGCNWLIKQGAGVLLSPEELLEELGFSHRQKMENEKQIKFVLETEENIVYSCLGFYPQNLEQLVKETKYPVSKLLDILMSLELRGIIKEISKNYYVKIES